MNALKLILNSLQFYWRTHLGVLAGTIISTTILVGALVVGDSVRYSLKQLTVLRLGQTEFALTAGDRFFQAPLADSLSQQLATTVAPLLQLNAIAVNPGEQLRANRVRVQGVDQRFWQIGNVSEPFTHLLADEAIVNQRLATQLNLQPDSELLVRVEKIDPLPNEAPLAAGEKVTVALRLTVKAIATAAQFSRFGLQTSQIPPYNIFVSLDYLNQQMSLSRRANLLLIATNPSKKFSLEQLNYALQANWQLADTHLELRELPLQNCFELRSDRIFLEEPVVKAAFQIDSTATGIFTYFVNHFQANGRRTPYSFIAAPGEPVVPPDLKNDEIIINHWLADDLGLQAGDSLEIAYYVFQSMRQLVEKTTRFRVKAVIPLAGAAVDTALMPMFPGLADAGSCREWEPGIPIKLDLIRDKDEDYWQKYRGTPKAFVTLAAAQNLWGNRFGNLTAIRFPRDNIQKEKISADILQNLNPASIGLQLLPVQEQGLRASNQAVDFSELFIGLSFFIILAALLLTGLLFVFGIEQRAEESGILLALGFSPNQVRRLLLTEGAIVAFLGVIPGMFGGIFYNQIVLFGLSTVWKGAVGTSAFQLSVEFPTLLTGTFISLFMAILAMWLALRRQASRSIVELQQSGDSPTTSLTRKRPSRLSLVVAVIGISAALIIFLTTSPGRGKAASNAFFGVGSLLLISALATTYYFLEKISHSRQASHLNLTVLGVRNSARRRGRSLATVGLVACGIFLVLAIGANRHDALKGTERRSAGTGGFAGWAEAAVPILTNLNSSEGKAKFGLNDINIPNLAFVQLRVREGDDASCLNLNRIENPRILGVNPTELARRQAFTFAKLSPEVDPANPWLVLNQKLDQNVIPAIADQTVIVWGLGKEVGDTLIYQDESGQSLKLKLVGGLANSIFQGNVIISEANFIKHFPSISGYRLFLIDAPLQQKSEILKELSRRFQNFGMEVESAAARLASFTIVENTYLSIFLALGALGMLLGTVGLGLVVLRNLLERRSELALLRAVGFSFSALRWLLFTEHGLLLLIGLVSGLFAAFFAVLPALLSPSAEFPFQSLAIVLLVILINGLAWIGLATRMATRRDLLTALRSE